MSIDTEFETLDHSLFAGYTIGKKLGEGGGGCVYEAYHKNLRKKVVIKKLKTGFSDEVTKRTEVDIMKKLRHSYIPTVIDYFEKDNIAYTVMDYIEGKSFGQFIKEKKKFSEKEVIKYLEQLCEAVSYLHSQKIPVIHGDIKPDNIMLTPEGQICLIDFNISGISNDGHAYTNGYTPGYSAPEQWMQFKAIVQKQKESDSLAAEHTELLGIDETETVLGAGKEETEWLVRNETEAVFGAEKEETEWLGGDETEAVFGVWKNETELLGRDETEAVFGGGKNETELLVRDETEAVFGAGKNETELLVRDETEALLGPARKETESIKQDNIERDSRENKPESEINDLILIDKRSDVYSIAATMFHILTGKKYNADEKFLFEADTSDGLIYILNKALSQNPQKRYRDAGEMLDAVKNIYKSDKNYRKLVLIQNFVRIFLFVMMIGGVMLLYFGRQKLQTENDDLYHTYIEGMNQAIQERNDASLVENYNLAIQLNADKADAYYYMMQSYYLAMDYEKVIEFANQILNGAEIDTEELLADIYYLAGKAYLELQDYEQADNQFVHAMAININKPDYYVADAIALSRLGNIEEAQKRLENAKGLGIADAESTLVSAELDFSLGNYQKAVEEFQKCIDTTQDDYSKLSSYIMMSKAYENIDHSKNNYNQNLSSLEKAINELPMEYQEMILQRIAQVAINAATEYPDSGYEKKAIEALEMSIKNGNTSFTVYNNLILLYQRIKKFEEATSYIDEMMDKFPEDYRVYKRAAFLELDIQISMDDSKRDYEKFKEYYDQTKSLYDPAKNMTDTADIQKLDQAYEELVNGGWF